MFSFRSVDVGILCAGDSTSGCGVAGDWIKMRGALLDHPKTIAMSRTLQADKRFREWLTPGGSGFMNGQMVSDHALRCVTTALLMKVWSVAREHGKFVGDDLVLSHSSLRDIDQMAGAPGVGVAMRDVHWVIEGGGLTLPNFIEFNVPMTNAEKQAEYRKRLKGRENGVTETLPTRGNGKAENVTTRVEKRREVKPLSANEAVNEKETTLRGQYPPSFERFWAAYPRKIGKGEALKAWERAKVDVDVLLAALAWQVKSRDWTKDNGQFIPHPATYLNHRRWEDSPHTAAQPPSRKLALDS